MAERTDHDWKRLEPSGIKRFQCARCGLVWVSRPREFPPTKPCRPEETDRG